MTFTVDSYSLNVLRFSEESEPVGAEWYAWEGENVVVKRFTYGLKRIWRLTCVEEGVSWSSSVAKYLQGKMSTGDTVSFAADEGDRYSLPATYTYVASLWIEYEPMGTRNIRRFTVTLREK